MRRKRPGIVVRHLGCDQTFHRPYSEYVLACYCVVILIVIIYVYIYDKRDKVFQSY